MNEEYYKTEKSVKEYIKAAEGFNGEDLIEKLKNYLPLHSSLLEIGSGPGTDWKILDRYFEVIGSDNSMPFLNHLIAKNPGAEFLKLNAITLVTDKYFDCIYSNKVLHHLKNKEIEASIERQYGILNTGGIICHSFWKGEGSETFKGLFVNYYSEKDFKNLFENYFEILLIESYKEFDNDDTILLIGKKK